MRNPTGGGGGGGPRNGADLTTYRPLAKLDIPPSTVSLIQLETYKAAPGTRFNIRARCPQLQYKPPPIEAHFSGNCTNITDYYSGNIHYRLLCAAEDRNISADVDPPYFPIWRRNTTCSSEPRGRLLGEEK